MAASDARALASLLTYTQWSPASADPALGREVVAALRGLGSRAAPALIEVLGAPRRGRAGRMVAAWLLGRIDRPEAARALVRASRDGDPEVAGVARRALAPRRDAEAAA